MLPGHLHKWLGSLTMFVVYLTLANLMPASGAAMASTARRVGLSARGRAPWRASASRCMIRRVGDDDGGLSDALERIDRKRAGADFSREIEQENARRERAVVEELLAKERTKVEAALTAFLAEAENLGIEPTTSLVGMRESGSTSSSSKRFGFRRSHPNHGSCSYMSPKERLRGHRRQGIKRGRLGRRCALPLPANRGDTRL